MLFAVTVLPGLARASFSDPGLSGVVRSLCDYNSLLVAGGDFTVAGADTVLHIAYLDNTGWHSLGTGLTGIDYGWTSEPAPPPWQPPHIRAILAYEGQIYAGGAFYSTDYSTTLRALARWNGSEWIAVGSGTALTPYGFCCGLAGGCVSFPPQVHCLAVHEGQLIVGGLFMYGQSACVACWDGSMWQGMGQGLNNITCQDLPLPAVDALVDWRGDLVAGGCFTQTASLTPIGPHLARWTAASGWASFLPADAALDGRVFALAVFENDLIVAGAFHNGGATQLHHVGRWDGTTWHAMGDGIPADVHALCLFGGNLYADGWQWDGVVWRDVLLANAPVLATISFSDQLVAGGEFTSALGGNYGHIVSWPQGLVSVQLSVFEAVRCTDGVRVCWSLGAGGESCDFTLWRQAVDGRRPVSDRRFTGAQQFTFVDADAGPEALQYWLRQEATAAEDPLWFGPAIVPAISISQLRLYPSHPNPFNPSTKIRFDLPAAGQVHLAVYDVAGRLVRVLVEGERPAGSHEAVWDGRDASGRSAPSGSYLARLVAGGKVEGVRLSLVR